MTNLTALIRFFLSNPSKQYYGREIARLTGINDRTVYRLLVLLVEEGIVIREAKAYSFNKLLAKNIFKELKFKL